ncbi:hypothetical protein AMTR_s00074p00199550 [Amborella trichopoda]|uniref:Uncharacterized protein n=1 Tax=Amborella trichopoda TaxID=13333 RepID=W1NPN9_AMBTC|nr:hypothetical protein AMTR_s00074p00199550 [Amborella trichopoda]
MFSCLESQGSSLISQIALLWVLVLYRFVVGSDAREVEDEHDLGIEVSTDDKEDAQILLEVSTDDKEDA